jgi:ABC-2 type transport system ATP-binding protein
MTAPVVVRTEGLTKRFPEGLVAVDDLDLEVFEGDLYGFLGPNGAGKSTTIRMLLGLVFPTAGSVEVLGQSVPRHSSEALLDVGALIEGPGFYPHLSGRRNLRLFDAAGRNGSRGTRRQRVEEVMERVGLADVGRRPVKAYSMGMRQRLGLAAALLRQPRLLILDEPTNGLDPQGIHELRTLFVELVHEGTTVFLSSHLLAEVELICTRAAMMANGKLVAQDRVDALLAPTGRLRIESPDASEAAAFLRTRHMTVEWLDQNHLRVHLNGEPAEAVNSLLVGRGLRVRELARERPTLEDVFLGLTGGVPSEPSADPLAPPLPLPLVPLRGEDRPAPEGSVAEDGS